ncbi:acyl-CoA dehydrogenase family protein [Sphingobium boeckii]|uniref:Alkylation response protein AidB-like acyl-CoA dehydrogenase n=1 Tax=Sphingobium boeckii TaxID=1082345 RepID=A0A7W9AJ84_9SPHN|nr:acyl-CoA dehydrogenase family protein [Sphingobium boeckii]MBB5686707.1 alkylation response protein AidB-like acyl-CoA dehydrogenase [Sphingobium boeckii]
MDLALSSDQIAILDAIDSLAKPYAAAPTHEAGFAMVSDALDRELAEGGFLDVAFDPDLGAVSAALIIERLARLPYAIEAAASALVRPLLGDDVSRPLCLVMEGKHARPIRFLKAGATVIVTGHETVSSFTVSQDQARAEDTLFGYPMGTLLIDPATVAMPCPDVSPEAVLVRWRVGLAAEAAGLLAAALGSTATYVTDRQQFGRPLATFQAIRHRLAEAQVRTNGVYWLAMKAAGTLDPGDAALAALHAQESARATVYDFHQFLGAMGMTLEHPLHLWTYRLKALIGALGGRGAQGLAAADAIWG